MSSFILFMAKSNNSCLMGDFGRAGYEPLCGCGWVPRAAGCIFCRAAGTASAACNGGKINEPDGLLPARTYGEAVERPSCQRKPRQGDHGRPSMPSAKA